MSSLSTVVERVLKEATENNIKSGGGPFAAAVVNSKTYDVLSLKGNSVTPLFDPSAHAEVCAIRDACSSIKSVDLRGYTLVSSCRPCPMCAAACFWAHVDQVVYLASSEDAARAGFDDALIYKQLSLPEASRDIPFRRDSEISQEKSFAPFAAWMVLSNDLKNRINHPLENIQHIIVIE